MALKRKLDLLVSSPAEKHAAQEQLKKEHLIPAAFLSGRKTFTGGAELLLSNNEDITLQQGITGTRLDPAAASSQHVSSHMKTHLGLN